jgi:hypothetical protein
MNATDRIDELYRELTNAKDSLAISNRCIADLRALMPKEWQSIELVWCVRELLADRNRLTWLAEVSPFTVQELFDDMPINEISAADNLRALVDENRKAT